MKNLDKRWLLFLVLILVLATGLPYLSLNQEASSVSESQVDSVQSMSIALVNEDEGAVFNGSELTFGEAFVRSLDSNDEHNWFVVSRGVAESGLNRNTYDMMIVIPNDFSEKALSIDSESPEQVVLNYQINASDDEYVKAEAERTASTILNEFNRRIIDVYFASIIGNLQDAQDHIGEIVEKQSQHTTTYNNDINHPLSNYTNQFGSIKDNTQVSRDSFGSLEDLLEGFEGRLADGADQKQGYFSELDEFTSMKEGNVNELLSFSDALLQFDQQLNNQDAERNLEQLQQANEYINFQLSQLGENETDQNIVSDIEILQGYLNESANRVDNANKILVERLEGLEKEVDEKVSEFLEEILEVSEEHEKALRDLFRTQNKVEKENIKERISELPSLDPDDFKDLPLKTRKDIENVITVTDKFMDEFEEVEVEGSNLKDGLLINKYEKKIIRHLKRNGVTITDTVILPGSEEGTQVFTLDLPKNYQLQSLKLKVPGEKWKSHTSTYLENGEVVLPINEDEGKFRVKVGLKLDRKVKDINILDPVELGWELHQQGRNGESEIDDPEDLMTVVPNSTLIASTNTENNEDNSDDIEKYSDEETNENGSTQPRQNDDVEDENHTSEDNAEESEKNNKSEEDGDNGKESSVGKEESDDDDNNSGNEDSGEENNGTEENNDNDDSNNGGDDSQEEEENEPEIVEVEIINNKVKHQVTKPVAKMDKATKSLINVVNNTVKPYHQLMASYENYFDQNIKNLLGEEDLSKLAGKNSLYKFFNDTDIEQIITSDMIDTVKENIYNEINNPLTYFQGLIERFRALVADTEQHAEVLMEKVRETREVAQVQNDNLAELFDQVANWREQSLNLLDQHGVVQENDMGEQQAIMTLNNDFQPLLSESQSIAEQAQGNLSSADAVYQTLDTIDGQADTIEQSGTDLVTQADQLSVEMTEKMVEDQEFVENFSNVLANSRVGERQNENLYNFLSNPVQTSNQGTITSGDNFTPYFLVLTIFIVVLFTAYVISTLHQKRTENDQFAHEKSLMGTNTPITLITAGIGVLEGIAIGVISSYLLQIGEGSMVLWTVLVTALITGMLLVATYLLRQLKMIGMFVLLIVMSMYLFLTNALGAGISGLDYLKAYSPLQYVESLLLQAVQGNANYLLAMLVIVAVIVIGTLANLFVLTREEKGDLENEGSEEAS